MCNRNLKTSKEYKYFQNYLNSFLALCQSNLFGQATEFLPSIYTSGKISLSFLASHSFSLSTPPKKRERKEEKKPFLIIALVQMCRAFIQNDGFPCLLHLFISFGRSNLQKALSIFAIIGTEMPHCPRSASSLSASQLSGQFVKTVIIFFQVNPSQEWGKSDENKIIFTLP